MVGWMDGVWPARISMFSTNSCAIFKHTICVFFCLFTARIDIRLCLPSAACIVDTHTHTHTHSLAGIFRVCALFSAALLLKWCKKCREKAHRKCVLVMCAITSEIAISFAFMNSSICERLQFRQFHCFHYSRSRSLTAEKRCSFGVGRSRRPQKKKKSKNETCRLMR